MLRAASFNRNLRGKFFIERVVGIWNDQAEEAFTTGATPVFKESTWRDTWVEMFLRNMGQTWANETV